MIIEMFKDLVVVIFGIFISLYPFNRKTKKLIFSGLVYLFLCMAFDVAISTFVLIAFVILSMFLINFHSSEISAFEL